MSAQDILKMIEEVDPSDTAKLNEIDFAVWQFLGNDKNAKSPIECGFDFGGIKYTRSRDALKSIRPEGWIYDCEWYSKNRFTARFYKLDSDEIQEESPVLPTEELAELHSIIQAIDFERTK